MSTCDCGSITCTVIRAMRMSSRWSAPRMRRRGGWARRVRSRCASVSTVRLNFRLATGPTPKRLGVLQTARGQLAEGLATLEEGVVAAERALMRAHCLTRLYAALARNRIAAGDLAAADQVLELGLVMSERHGHCTTCDALLLPAAVSVRVAQRDLEAAEDFCRKLDAAAAEYASRTWVAMARQARGELTAAQGDLDAALRYYTEAHAAYAAASNAYEAARCLAAAAELRRVRRAPGDIETACAEQAEVQRAFELLGVA